MTAGILITFGILLLIPGIFFFAPGLAAIMGAVTSDKTDEFTRIKYRPLAKTLLSLGFLLTLAGIIVGLL